MESPVDLLVTSNYLDQFNLLQKSGVLGNLESLRKENREFETLINDAASLFSMQNVEEMIEFVISRLLDRFIPTHLVFVIETPQGNKVDQYCYRNLKKSDDEFPIGYFLPLKEFFVSNPIPWYFGELEQKLETSIFKTDFRRMEPAFFIPMRGIGGLHGFVVFGKKVLGDEYSVAEVMFVDRFIRFLSIAIQNNLHHESSITDLKTSLYNHSYFMKRLNQEISRVERHHSKAGVVMIDIDHFKKFNDSYGHLAGDEVLKAIAANLKNMVRSEDVPARFGGEEFVLLLVECDELQLLYAAERIRHSIEELKVRFKGEILSVTISLGCCNIDPAYGISSAGFLEKADLALYDSKTNGRNCVTLYKPGLLNRAIGKLSSKK
jgi:diguanylate cyclase (GGDEF)-like protein